MLRRTGTAAALRHRLAHRRPLAVFMALTLAWSWGWWLTMLVLRLHVAPGLSATHIPGLLGPAFAALIVTAWTKGRSGLMEFGHACLDPRAIPGIGWLIGLAPMLLALPIARVAGASPSARAWLAVPGVPDSLPAGLAFLVILIGIGFGEEAGWRAFAFHRLQSRGRHRAAMIVGLLWMIWHLPLFWLNAGMTAMVGPMLAGWAVSIFGGSILLGWLWLAAGARLWPAALFHALFDMATASEAASPTGAALVSAPVFLAAFLIVRAWRRHPLPLASRPSRE